MFNSSGISRGLTIWIKYRGREREEKRGEQCDLKT
jgi:hypothetical protein